MEIDVVTVDKKIKRRFQHIWGDKNTINVPGLEAIGELARLLEGTPFPDAAGLEAVVNALINSDSYKQREEIEKEIINEVDNNDKPIQIPRKRGRPPGKSNAIKHTPIPIAPPRQLLWAIKEIARKIVNFLITQIPLRIR